MRKKPIPTPKIIPEEIALNGGLDTETPTMRKKPGTCRFSQNFYQSPNGGYGRIAGYERTDGRAKPSDATFIVLPATITGAAALGNVLTGLTSAATGTIIALPGGQFVLTKVTGTYLNGESLQIAAVTIATATGDPQGTAGSGLLNAQYTNLAADVYRALIGVVPGSGSVRGIVHLNNVKYAFRDNAGGTAGAIYKSSSSGWTLVTLLNEISFTAGGAVTPADGATLTQGGVTATVSRVMLQTGAWLGSTAAGRLIIGNPAGGNFGAGAATLTGGVTLTLSGIQTAITISPGGRYEFDIANFGGGVNTNRIYGADGVNRGFEFDGTTYAPIVTGMSPDNPLHVKEHMKQLFFSFIGSAQHSGPGTPFIWSAVLGAGELGMGDTITAFAEQAGTTVAGSTATGAMMICTRNRISILYGTGVSNWVLTPYRKELGAFDYTMQDVGINLFLDDRGITSFDVSEKYGNFSHEAISNDVKTGLMSLKPFACASTISRDLDQYRLFFSSGDAYYCTVLNGQIVGIMPIIFPDVVRCSWSGEDNNGNEIILFGTDSGYVMEMEKGTSFDGASIAFEFDLAYNFSNSPRIEKHYRHATLEVEGSSYAEFNVGYSVHYGITDTVDQPDDQNVITNFSSINWDSGFFWDSGEVWDGQTLMPSEVTLGIDAECISMAIRGDSDYIAPFVLTGIVVAYTPRRLLRS